MKTTLPFQSGGRQGYPVLSRSKKLAAEHESVKL